MEFRLEYEFAACVVLLAVMFFFFGKERLYQINGKIFAVFLFALLLDLLADIGMAYEEESVYQMSLQMHEILHSLHQVNQMLLAWLFTVYGMSQVGLFNRKNYRLGISVALPGIVGVIVVARSLILTFVTKENSIGNSSTYFVEGIILFYLLFCMLVMIKKHKKMRRLEFIVLFLQPIAVVGAERFQSMYPEYRIVIPMVVFATLMIYMAFQNPDIYIDGLTGLYRRNAFLEILENRLRNHRYAELLIIDLNEMKSVNELIGNQGVNQLLQTIAQYLQNLRKEKKELFRVDGDNFIFLLDHEDSELAETVRQRFQEEWDINGGRIKLTASISRIAISKYLSNPNLIMEFIEKVTSYTKKQGRGSFVDVNDEVSNELMRSIQIEKVIRNLKEEEVIVFYQPIYSISKDRIIGMESLVRIQNKELGMLFPDEFIGIAERTGMINFLGMTVLEKTCEFIMEHHLCERGLEFVDVNLSTIQCMQRGLADKIEGILEKYQVPPEVLVLEITESAVISSKDRLHRLMERLAKQGVRFSMDDYGSGYSNSGSIVDLQLKTIKLDKLMLWDSMDNEKAKVIYTNTVQMFQKLQFLTVAEGAENEDQLAFLKSVNVDYVQGYYFSRPVPGQKILSMFA